MTENTLVYDASRPIDPLGDADSAEANSSTKNYAKVGSARPSSLLYTYGPGAIMDLPHFTVLPMGLDDWEPIWRRRSAAPTIHAPRLLEAVRTLVASSVDQLRPFPWQPKTSTFAAEGADLGLPARVFPQWLRCTGCDKLEPLSGFNYRNTKKFRPDEASFEHPDCQGRPPRIRRSPVRQPAVAARYLLACTAGHLDEFPYFWWVHQGGSCPKAPAPRLFMRERGGGKGASATIECGSCSAKRSMAEAQGEVGRSKLPACRGRHPHLDGFEPGCTNEPRLMVIGASNLWFPALESIIDMPRLNPDEVRRDNADRLRGLFGDQLAAFRGQPGLLRISLGALDQTLAGMSDADLDVLIDVADRPRPTEDDRRRRRDNWDPIDLLVPEWHYLQRDPAHGFHADAKSGLTLSPRTLSTALPARISRVLAVDRLRKVNALVGFTRIDERDRVADVGDRLVRLNRVDHPTWAVATEDRGEGIFLQFDESAVADWEARVRDKDGDTSRDSKVWKAHRQANAQNVKNRFSETAEHVDPDTRLRPPRYWLLHTFAHILFRELALSSGYGAASISERIYAWEPAGNRPAAAGVLICTTASDSDGTLGGLVRLSEPELLARLVVDALRRARRCSSDPVCAVRLPKQPEDFLHGAACHCCVMASETSCERANRFLDRRFLVPLPGTDPGLAFFS